MATQQDQTGDHVPLAILSPDGGRWLLPQTYPGQITSQQISISYIPPEQVLSGMTDVTMATTCDNLMPGTRE